MDPAQVSIKAHGPLVMVVLVLYEMIDLFLINLFVMYILRYPYKLPVVIFIKTHSMIFSRGH